MSSTPPLISSDSGDARELQREELKARIVAGARDRYLRGQRIELTALAAEHGIGRATAYRWFGGNDRLLAEVLEERVLNNFRDLIREHADKSGRDRVLAVIDGVMRHAVKSERFEALLRREPTRVLKILTSDAYDIQDMEISLLVCLLDNEHAAGNLQLSAPAHILAFGIIKLLEAYLYADVFAGEQRDIDSAIQIVALLLGED